MTTATLSALIFDVDGTLADTESAHRAAFNTAFREAGLDWNWDEALYTRLLEVSGGKERIRHYWSEVNGEMRSIDAGALADTVQRIHDLKTACYEGLVNEGAVQLRPGVLALIESASQQGLRLAIATTTSPVNIAALLRKALGADWKYAFQVVEDASTAPLKKPHPQVYLQTLSRMRLAPEAGLAFEDSGNGLRAARGAGLATLVTPNAYTAHHDFSGALRVLPDLAGIGVGELRAWHAEAGR
ncbi:MAG: HAD-IA family hydrolase [Burkholderiales bacterium]|nr:HAD-IA family hydrolase [Burkholderiales bacterium]MDE2397092.1 HAD-IA family hydrolase [Burkholderiales bacterium]